MSKDKIKEKLAEYRFWRGVIVASIVAIIGWFISNYKNADNVLLCFCIGVVIVELVALVAVSFGINDKIDEL